MAIRSGILAVGVAAVAVAAGGAWYTSKARVREIKGDCGEAYSARICTYARMVGDQVQEVGIVVPDALADNVPAEQPMVWPPRPAAQVAFPNEVRQATGIEHLTVFWEEHGHPPGPYLVPHFDFHFYVQPAAETAAIDCKDLSKPARLPADYQLPDVPIPGLGTLIGLCVPGMGMHAASTAELTSKEPWRGSLIAGYYKGKLIFFEPMLPKSLLKAHQSFPLTVPPLEAPANVRLPTHFSGDYDAGAHAYRFVFSGFQKA